MHPTRLYSRYFALWLCILVISSCGSPATEPTGPALLSPEAIAAAVTDAYRLEFGVEVPKPAIYNDTLATYCSGGHLMTTAYIPMGAQGPRRLLMLYMSRDGRRLVPTHEGGLKRDAGVITIIPAGTFHVLTVLVAHPGTVTEQSTTLLNQAQETINAQHATFAESRGYASPIVQFVFTNVAVPVSGIADPRSLVGVSAATAQIGVDALDFDFVVAINPDPAIIEGGRADVGTAAPHFVYMGNFGPWSNELTAANFTSIARAAYHHEIGHHWGWRHDWVVSCGGLVVEPLAPFVPFITAPVLFGWEDTDGDGVPEILDSTPYGR
jgi:hypothetical protein